MASQGLMDEIISACQNLQKPAIVEVDSWAFENSQVDQTLRNLNYFVARIDPTPVSNKNELLQALVQSCKIPEYFGFNWDALMDSLIDFYWQPAEGYILMFRHPEKLNTSDFDIFLDIIREVSTVWSNEGIPFKLLVPQSIVEPN